jgi:hypothetical protein
MSVSASCPNCGNSLKAPDRLAGQRVKCLQCQTFFTLTGAAADGAVTAAPPAGLPASSADSAGPQAAKGAIRAAFWLGLAALALGVAAVVTSLFPAAAGHSRTLAWLGIVLGGGAVVLAIVREECGFTLPFTGSAASLLSLALVALWLGAAAGPGEGMWGRPPGPPGGPGQGPPPEWKGGPPPGWQGGPPGEKGKDRPPPGPRRGG